MNTFLSYVLLGLVKVLPSKPIDEQTGKFLRNGHAVDMPFDLLEEISLDP
jgi:hypothetical protein